jgi:HD superfamily phosphohydrolase
VLDFWANKRRNWSLSDMSKVFHEIRDPIHVFIRLNSYEKLVLDSRSFQRLRNITQLALTYLLYPGATHKRFEHSLGVMELAGRVFDVITSSANVTDEMRDLLPDLGNIAALAYWKQVLRMAALCHDIGHLPFSHAAEEELLPTGWN